MAEKSEYIKALESSLVNSAEQEFISQFIGDEQDSKQAFKRQYFQTHLDRLHDRIDDTNLTWKHQQEAIENTRNFFAKPDNAPRAVTLIPTGGGKTQVFTNIVYAQARNIQADGDVTRKITPPTLILVPTKQLLQQTVKKFRDAFPGLEVGQYYDRKKDIQPLTVMTYDGFMDLANSPNGIKPEDISLLILDEAHHGLSDRRWEVFERFKDKTVMLGYTASPSYDYSKNTDNEYMRDVNKVFGEHSTAYGTTFRRLVDDGVLAPIDNYILHVDVQFEPDAIPKDPDKLRTILREARLRAMLEFYLTHEDPETGHMLLGETTIGFNRYAESRNDASSAVGAAKYFEREIRKRMKDDSFIRERLSGFKRIADYISGDDQRKVRELLGDDENEGTLAKGQVMAMFNSKYAREGTDVPRISNVLNIHGSTSLVETLQGDGRGVRKWKHNPNKRCCIVDAFVTVNGKPSPVEDRPLFFFQAVNDDSVVKSITTEHVHIDAATAQELLRAGEEHDRGGSLEPTVSGSNGEEEDKGTEKPLKAREVDYKDRANFRRLTIGTGTAAKKFRPDFDDIFDRLERHHAAQATAEHPEAFYVDGMEVPIKTVARGENTVTLVNTVAVPAFRNAIGFPTEKTAEYRDATEFRADVLGKGEDIEQKYGQKFDALWQRLVEHYEKNQHLREIPPFRLNGDKVACIECVDDKGDLMLTVPYWAKRAFRDALGIPRDKTPRWRNKEQFRQLVIGGAAKPELYEEAFERFWQKAEHHHREQPRTSHTELLIVGGAHIPCADCLTTEGQSTFCISREAVSAVRKALSVDLNGWKRDASQLIDGVSYTTKLDDIHRVLKRLEQGYPEKTDEWLAGHEIPGAQGKALKELLEGIEIEYKQKEQQRAYALEQERIPIIRGGQHIRVKRMQSGSVQPICYHRDDIELLRSAASIPSDKTEEWKNVEEFTAILGAGGNREFKAFWDGIRTRYEAAPTELVVIDGHTVNCGLKKVSERSYAFCLHVSEEDWLRKQAKKEVADLDGFKSRSRMADLLGISHGDNSESKIAFNQLWSDIESKYVAHASNVEPFNYENHPLKCGYNSHFYVHESEVNWFKNRLGLYDHKTEEWKARGEVEALVKVDQNNAFLEQLWESMRKQLEEKPNEPLIVDEHTVRYECRRPKGGGRPTLCLHASEIEWVREKVGKHHESKTIGWMKKPEFASLLGLTHSNEEFSAIWDQAQGLYQGNQLEPVVIDGHTLQCGTKLSGKHTIPTFCMHEDEKSWFQEKLNLKTEEWKTNAEMRKLIGVSYKNDAFMQLWDRIKTQYDKSSGAPVVIDNHALRVGYKKNRSQTAFNIHVSEQEWFKKQLGLTSEKATPEWRLKGDFAELVGVSYQSPSFDSLWDRIKAEYETNPTKPIVIDGHTVQGMNKLDDRGLQLFHIHQSESEWFKQKLGINIAKKQPGWLSQEEFATEIGVDHTTVRPLWTKLRNMYDQDPARPVIVDGHTVQFRKLLNERNRGFHYIHESEAEWFKHKLGRASDYKTDEDGQSNGQDHSAFASEDLRGRKITSRSIDPASAHIHERTGFQRAQGGDQQ